MQNIQTFLKKKVVLELVATRTLDPEMRKILHQNSLLRDRVIRILDENIQSLETSTIGRILITLQF